MDYSIIILITIMIGLGIAYIGNSAISGMNFSFIAYIFITIIIGLGSFNYLNGSGRTWAGIISIILFVLIFVFYGIRWFRGTSSAFNYSGSWPPMINMCPDYLVYFKKPDGTDTCIDLLGVNRSGGALKPWTKDDSPANPPEDPQKYFPYVYTSTTTPDQLQTLCTQSMQNGLTWEGITNGESCTFTASS